MPYEITDSIKRKASALGVQVKPSTRAGKKLDVYKDGIYQASIGALGYKDYEIYKQEKGTDYANEKRRQYKARHEKNILQKYRDGKMTAGYLAWRILW
jgi:hypothetical protein